MPTESSVEVVEGRGAAMASVTDGPEDISDGRVIEMNTRTGDATMATLYLCPEGAVEIAVELSPNGGDKWIEPADSSPVTFSGAGEDIVVIEAVASHLRVTGNDATAVDVDIRVRA